MVIATTTSEMSPLGSSPRALTTVCTPTQNNVVANAIMALATGKRSVAFMRLTVRSQGIMWWSARDWGMRRVASTMPLAPPSTAMSAMTLGNAPACSPKSLTNMSERLASPASMTVCGPRKHEMPTKYPR